MSMMSDDYRRAIQVMRHEAKGRMRIVDRAWSEAMRDAAEKGKTAPELQDIVNRIKRMCGSERDR